jgi:hypothetical protein
MPPSLIVHGTATCENLERSEPSKPTTWRLGVLTDNDGHVHLGAVVAGHGGERCTYVDLLAAVGAASRADLDLTRVVVLSRPQHVVQLREIAERCIDNDRLKRELVELADLTASSQMRPTWTA